MQPKYSCLPSGPCHDWRDFVTVPACHELNPIFGQYPSNGRFVATEIAITFGEIVSSHFLRKHGHKKLAAFILFESTVEHTVGGMWNTQQSCF